MARPSPSSFDKSKQRNGLRVSAQLFMLIKDDPTNAIAVTDLQLGITVDEVKQFVSREFGIDPACFHLEDLNGSPLDGSFALCEGTLPENTYSVVCENPSDIPKFDLARFSEAPSEMDSQSERPRSPSSSSSASSSPSVFSPPHRRLQFSPPPPESFASQPLSISPSQSESPLVPPADERPLMLGSFFDVRSVRSGVTAASEYQGAGLLCEFSSLLLRDKVPEMVGICQGIPLPALLSSIPFLCGIDHPQVFEFLQRSCQTCPVFANRLFFFANERPAFQHLAPLLASIPTPPMLPYCIDGVASFQKGQVVEFHGSHPITSEPISGFRIDHVFSSLARPLIISFLPPTNQSSVDPPPSPCVSSSSSSSVNSSVSQQSSQPPSQPSSSLDHPGNALATESYCRVLMKFNEDIYHETAIQLLFKSMNEIWIDHLPPPLQPFVCSFRELPATPKLGFLQIVEGCLDLEVVELANFEQIQPSSRDNFVRTTCGWCLAAYLLGLSDRHRENTLVRVADGSAIPIDFGFMLGNVAPSTNTYMITISAQMYQYLLDNNSWTAFATMFICGFICVRQHSELFLSLAAHLFRDHRNPSFVRRFIANRLLLKIDDPIQALDRLVKRLRHAPICSDTRSKIDNHRKNKEFLAKHGKNFMVRMIIKRAVEAEPQIHTQGRFHRLRVPLALPPPAAFPPETPLLIIGYFSVLYSRYGPDQPTSDLSTDGHLSFLSCPSSDSPLFDSEAQPQFLDDLPQPQDDQLQSSSSSSSPSPSPSPSSTSSGNPLKSLRRALVAGVTGFTNFVSIPSVTRSRSNSKSKALLNTSENSTIRAGPSDSVQDLNIKSHSEQSFKLRDSDEESEKESQD